MNENFSENLKKARRDAQMTQAEVAKIVGVAKNTYCNWEQGTREPNILKIKALAKALGIIHYPYRAGERFIGVV